MVTPLVGVWIEISEHLTVGRTRCVTPLVGVWIEISSKVPGATGGLVTPLVGVWIEISFNAVRSGFSMSHSPCGSVD